jgi:hypothetical protein
MTKDTTTDKGPATIKYVGLDVHKDTIAVAVADDGKPDGSCSEYTRTTRLGSARS